MSRVLPILFNTEMVLAILDGRKTVTRRVMKPQPKSKLCYTFAGSHKKDIGRWGYPSNTAHEFWGKEFKLPEDITEEELKKKWNPQYHTDDILYVRETWGEGYEEGTYIYKADDKLANLPEFKESSKLIYRPSIHMPKEAARIWLKVKDVRVERLQCMSWDDICNEGIISDSNVRDDFSFRMLQNKFRILWNSTIKKSDLDRYGWGANPYVFVIEFERCDKPERWCG